MPDTRLDVDFCRSFFPPLSSGEVYFENAGGTYAPRQVIDSLDAFMRECQCQPGWQFPSSRLHIELKVEAQATRIPIR